MNKTLVALTIASFAVANALFATPSYAQDKMATSKMMAKDAVLVTTGQFKRVTHVTKGTATIYEMKDGTRELRLTNFSTEAGPALHVYLVAAEDAKDSESVKKAGHIDLGALKPVKGAQTFQVPAKIDLWKYLAVTVWCEKFSVNFGTAPLGAKR